MEDKSVYVVLTSTASKFGKIVRVITHNEYNHLALATTDDLSDICAFARRKYKTPLNAGFVHEKLEYYTLNDRNSIRTKVYKIPVTKKQYNKLVSVLNEIENDPEYMYNLFSAITYPFIGGFRTYKAYTCVEFVATVLDETGIVKVDKAHKITPEEYGNIIDKYEYYVGNLENIMKKSESIDYDFFTKDSLRKYVWVNTKTVAKLSKRLGSKIKGKVLRYEVHGKQSKYC